MKSIFYGLLLFVSLVCGQITAPSSTTVWVNGQVGQINWSGLAGTEFTIVLYRTGTPYHHTIISYTANTGSYAWIVNIPSQDGWPASTSSQQVYEIDFYVNGGWNNGGQLVAKSQQFAIEYNDPSPNTSPVPVQTTTITNNDGGGGGYGTSTQTVVVVGVTTFTTVITEVYPVTWGVVTQTVTQSPPPVVTSTVTDLAQLSSTRTTMITTLHTGATTIGGTGQGGTTTTPVAAGLISAGNANFNTKLKLVGVMVFIIGAVFFNL